MSGRLIGRQIISQVQSWIKQNPPQHSVCKVFVASHVYSYHIGDLGIGKYDLSRDTIQCTTEETFDGATVNLTVMPSRPYHEMVWIGDWISVYLSTGADARPGFGVLGQEDRKEDNTRVFMGFIDAVRRSTTTDPESGTTTVRYSISCSGIIKVFDRTTIYYNPDLANNSVFRGLLPGIATLANGIPLDGTPTTIPRALALGYLGFGGQFILPEYYPLVNGVGTADDRKKRLKSFLERDIQLERDLGFLKVRGTGNKPQKDGLIQRAIKDNRTQVQGNSIASIIDFFTYVDDYAVDGRVINAGLHDMQGSLWQLMRENSNPVMNEMFVTLKPSDPTVFGAGSDEWGQSPKYIPALVVREKPFSTTDATLRVPSKDKGRTRDLRFGSVFFSDFNNPVKVQSLQNPDTTSPFDIDIFLDRVKILPSDISNETIGMSDNDMFNFWTIGSASIPLTTGMQKYTLQQEGLIPMFLSESIKRYGLRVQDITTKFMHRGGAKRDSRSVFDFLVRMLLAQDIWYQKQPWYQAGTITTHGIPKARVGMCLDIGGSRQETFYIEGVSHEWSHSENGGHMETTFTVTRGQPSGFTDPSKRFKYAPPSVVQMFATSEAGKILSEIKRDNAIVQPKTLRSPFSNQAKSVDALYAVIDNSLPDTVEGNQAFLQIQAEVKKKTGGDSSKESAVLILGVVSKSINLTTAEKNKINAEWTKRSSKRLMPSEVVEKQDRLDAALPPYIIQAELIGAMWDPIRRVNRRTTLKSQQEEIGRVEKAITNKGKK